VVYNFVVHKVVNQLYIVTYLFTSSTTNKEKLSRQIDDAENECGIRLVSTFVW
jgi:hypothetical protein